MSNYKEIADSYKGLIETVLPGLLPDSGIPQGAVAEAMAYSLCGGGKRVRGTLVLAFYQLFGGTDLKAVLPFAASLEMVHGYSLIHDDLPCMDNDLLRRGKPSCHVAFGESTALLAGDGLLTLAFEVLANQQYQDSFSAQQILTAIELLGTASGTNGMIGGQVLDLANEGREISGAELEATDRLKTGALITAAAVMGSMLGGASQEQQQIVAQYAGNIGLAFQIIDDILDTTSTPELLGKPIDSDREKNKSTYTSLYGVKKAEQMASDLTISALDGLRQLGLSDDFLVDYTRALANRDY